MNALEEYAWRCAIRAFGLYRPFGSENGHAWFARVRLRSEMWADAAFFAAVGGFHEAAREAATRVKRDLNELYFL